MVSNDARFGVGKGGRLFPQLIEVKEKKDRSSDHTDL